MLTNNRHQTDTKNLFDPFTLSIWTDGRYGAVELYGIYAVASAAAESDSFDTNGDNLRLGEIDKLRDPVASAVNINLRIFHSTAALAPATRLSASGKTGFASRGAGGPFHLSRGIALRPGSPTRYGRPPGV